MEDDWKEGQPCPSFVISKSAESLRFRHMTASLAALGRQAILVPAFYLTPEQANEPFLGISFASSTLPRGARGCFLSHVLAWQMLVESGAPYGVVYEDDVIFSADAAVALNALEQGAKGFDLIRLEATRLRSIFSRAGTRLAPGYRLHRFHDIAIGTAAYHLTREAATRLIVLARQDSSEALDLWLFYRRHRPDRALSIATLNPCLTIQYDQLLRRPKLPVAWQDADDFKALASTMQNAPAPDRPLPAGEALENLGREVVNLFTGRVWDRPELPSCGPLRLPEETSV